MPFGDGTGPAGLGPMTGRAAGYCAGYPVPGYMNPMPGRGIGGWMGAPSMVSPMGAAPPLYPYYGTTPYGPMPVAQLGWGYGRGFGRGWGRGWGRGRGRGRWFAPYYW